MTGFFFWFTVVAGLASILSFLFQMIDKERRIKFWQMIKGRWDKIINVSIFCQKSKELTTSQLHILSIIYQHNYISENALARFIFDKKSFSKNIDVLKKKCLISESRVMYPGYYFILRKGIKIFEEVFDI